MTSTEAGARGWGETLRRARTTAGHSLEHVSARTRIRPVVLRDLEAGVTASSGGDVYARGHVRSVAQALGLDPAPLLAAFDRESGRPAAPVVEPAHLTASRVGSLGVPAPERPERRGPHWGGALVAALSVLVLLLVVGSLGGPDPARGPAPADEVFAEPDEPASAPPTASPPPLSAAVPPPSGARLRVRVLSGSSWMRVQGAGGTLFEGVFAGGQPPKDFSDAKELRLLVGNAAALSVVCGGKDLAPAGTVGAVRRFTCSANGLVAA